ncbi:IS481 family transposase [Pseudoxanthomonas suwonensis]|uniref:IS481 family transposase n=1 Tax=Pseudoxanthomonas suwonensis TaxID=314722 RepID=UPI00138F13B3|nr:IS481 family transposase [Pseudoxanthomonas suwonensis]KAF1705483.1 IS481 family transposase [Pseudoxanthomonas suwonensis]
MNLHHHARLSPRGRALLVDRILVQGLRVEEAAQAAGVSVRTAYKWLKRFREEGAPGLFDRSSQPHACPHATPQDVVDQVLEQRRSRQTYRQIAAQLSVAPSTVARLLRRAGLHRLAELEPALPENRYEHPQPGDLLHLDIKKLARFRQPGYRVTGNRQINSDGVGWEYVHLAIDDHSRVAFGSIEPDERGISACKALLRAVRYYRGLGVRFERVLTDNGACYRSRSFRRLARRLGMRHLRTRPYTPRTNGKAERLVQTSLREWAYARAYANSAQRAEALVPWLHHYNWHRPHASLGYKPPISRIPLNNVLGLHT